MTSMSLAALLWLGLHLIVAGPLRSSLVDELGENAFQGVFSLLSFAGLVWFVVAYRNAPWVPLWQTPPALGWLAIVLIFLGFVLVVVGVGPMNATDTNAPRVIDSRLPVYGVTRVTRHPRLCGISLWAIAHMLANGHLAAFLMFGSLLVTALNGMVSIDRKRRHRLAAVWDEFEAQTSRLPFDVILTGRTRFELAEFHFWQVPSRSRFSRGFFGCMGSLGRRRSMSCSGEQRPGLGTPMERAQRPPGR